VPVTHSPLRILQVGPLPPPLSGIGVSLQQLLASAALRAHHVVVLDSSARDLPGDPARAKRPTPRRLARHVALAIRTAHLVRTRNIDVVHLHGSTHDLSLFGNALSILSARAAGARTVWQLHDDLGVVAFPGDRRQTQALFSWVMALSNAVAVLSERDRAVARKYIDCERVTVLAPTCSAELTTVPIERPRLDSLEVLFIGWLTEAKGIYDVLRVAEQLRECQRLVRFKVVGSGMSAEETAAVHRQVAQRGLTSTVELCGVLNGEHKRTRFASADLLFLPTHWDAFPVAILEGMAAGLPIVSTRVGGVPHLVEHGQGGLLADVGDVACLAEHIMQLAMSPVDRVNMGRFNRERFLANSHPEVIAKAAVALYWRLVQPQVRPT